MTADGKFVMIHKNSGMSHADLSLLLPEEPVSAGFIYVQDGKLIAYGESVTLDLDAGETDTDVIMDALDGNSVRIQFDELCDRYFAGNIDHLKMLPDEVTLETLIHQKVIA